MMMTVMTARKDPSMAIDALLAQSSLLGDRYRLLEGGGALYALAQT